MPARKMMNVRVSPAAEAWIKEVAEGEKVTRADVVRAMLSTATAHGEEVRKRLVGLNAAEKVAP